MEIIQFNQVNFSYANSEKVVLKNVSFSVKQGEFIVLSGSSGSGKSTLLRLIKQEIAPYGKRTGRIMYQSTEVSTLDKKQSAKEIGFVFQDPENQFVMDTVIDELSFGLENLGYHVDDIHKKLAEMVHFFDIEHLLNRQPATLSGGEKQLINLVAVLLLEPELLLLDEPFAQLDPIAQTQLLQTLKMLNEAFGMTIIIAEHKLDELLVVADRLLVLERGDLVACDEVSVVVQSLLKKDKLTAFLPETARLVAHFSPATTLPLTVNETRNWLRSVKISAIEGGQVEQEKVQTPFVQLKNIDFQYDRYGKAILNNAQARIYERDILAIVGANGTGKTTFLKVLLGILKQQHGHFIVGGKKCKQVDKALLGYLPQNPHLLFTDETIGEALLSVQKQFEVPNERYLHFINLFQLDELLEVHPFDLSGGELQRAALLKIVLRNPALLVLDEPTKGIDPEMKQTLGELFHQLNHLGMTIVMVTHDIEFAAKYARRCGLLFRGGFASIKSAEDFFNDNAYYTTVMNRITRGLDVPLTTTFAEAVKSWQIHE